MSKYLAKTFDSIVDTGPSETAPHLPLITGDDRFAGELFDLFSDFECTYATTTEKNGFSLGSINF
jgi:hypothetical protein